MQAVQTFQNKPIDHLWNWGFPSRHTIPLGSSEFVNSTNVEGTVFQTFLNYKQRSCIQFITNEQVKLISFIWEGVDFTLGIRYVPLTNVLPWLILYPH